jgi:Na+-translocating ferredoxin:NAD+ oxidoreductase subunit B
MTNDVYVRLREFLDKLPAGFPETPTGVEIKLLKKMFTPEQAELTMKLTSEPETPAQIAGRTGMNEADLAVKLEEMAQNGLIFRVREGDEKRYQAFQFVVGLYEFQLNRLDKEFCELFEEYMPYVGMSMAMISTSQLRVVPVASALKGDSRVAPYNRVREMVEREDVISVTQCICKKERGIMGDPCQKPQEVCMMFGKFAQFYIDNDNARQLTREEAFKVLDMAEENGLVLSPTNSQKLEALCCCCSCCCPTLKNIKIFPNPGEMVTSYYRSVIDGELCTGCGECITICPMDAIKDEEGISVVMAKRCIGCGLCVNRCPVDAISMAPREDRTLAPPKTFDETIEKIAAERGL